MEPVTKAGKCVERPIRAAKHMDPARRAKKKKSIGSLQLGLGSMKPVRRAGKHMEPATRARKHRDPTTRAGKHGTFNKGRETYGICI